MRFIGILITLAAVGYAISIYLGSSSVTTASPDGGRSQPKDYIDQAKQSVGTLNQTLQKHKEKLDNSN